MSTLEQKQEPQFVQMSDEEMRYEEECVVLANRGRRLRRAALYTGILTIISIICTIYSTVAVRWILFEWQQPERMAYDIRESIVAFKIGIFFDVIVCVLDIIIGITLGLILVGAGVNPASSCTLVTFKIVQQAVSASNLIFLIAGGLMLDESLPIADIILKYFYSDNMPPIGTQITYLLLVINQYGFYLSQIFGGVYMFMFGFTIVYFGVFPRFMGYCMCFGGCGYIINSCLFLFWPGYDGIVTWLLLLPALFAHFWLGGWLLVNTPYPAKNQGQQKQPMAAYYENPVQGQQQHDPVKPGTSQT